MGRKGKPLHYKGSIFHRVIPDFMCVRVWGASEFVQGASEFSAGGDSPLQSCQTALQLLHACGLFKLGLLAPPAAGARAATLQMVTALAGSRFTVRCETAAWLSVLPRSPKAGPDNLSACTAAGAAAAGVCASCEC